MTSSPTRKRARAIGSLVVAGALGIVFAGGSGAQPVPTPTPSASQQVAREAIPQSCRELLADPPSASPHQPFTLNNATVLTMDSTGSRAGSVSVQEGRIAGTSQELGQPIDLEGATVMPGFIDSHGHWIGDAPFIGQSAQQAIAKALSWGWTSISELFVSFERLEELCELESSGALRMKVGAFLPLNYGDERFGTWYDDYTPGESFGPHVWVQGLKFFADRANDGLGYQTDPPSRAVQGEVFWRPRGLAAAFRRAHDAGWQIATHATGDGGLDLALEAYSALGRDAIVQGRHRVEHLTIVRDGQVGRLRRLGLIGSIQLPWFHAGSAKTILRWVGRDRIDLAGRWRDLIDAGVPITGSSDRPWSIVGRSGGSMPAIAKAVTRISPRGKFPPPWMRSQRMTRDEALRSITMDAAFAQGKEASLGSIEPDKVADLVILSADPTMVARTTLKHIRVLATIVDGRVEYCVDSVPADLQAICP